MFAFTKGIYHFIAYVLALPFHVMTKLMRHVCVAEIINCIPFRIGELIRYYFYKNTLAACGDDVVINFGTIISYPDKKIDPDILVGAN